MNIDANIESKDFSYIERVGASQIMVECDINLEGKGGLSRLLSVTGDVTLNKIDSFLGEAKVYGKIDYNIVYLDANSLLSSLEYCSDFVESIGSSVIDSESCLSAYLSLADIDSMAKGNSVRTQSIVDITLGKVNTNKCDIVTSVKGAFEKCQNIETSLHIGSISDKVDISDVYETGANVENILYSNVCPYVKRTKPSHDSIGVEGEAGISLVYTSDGKTYTKNMAIPFMVDIKCLGADDTSTALAKVTLEDTKITIAGVEDNNVIKVDAVARVDVDVYEYASVSVLADAYSCDKVLDIERSDIEYTKIVEYKADSERIEGEYNSDKSISKFIMAIPRSNTMTNVKVEEGTIKCDTLASVDLIYMSQDNEYVVSTVTLPASIDIDSKCIEEGDKVWATASITGVTCRVKREHDIDISIDVVLSCVVLRPVSLSLITSIEEGEACENKHKPITIYRVKPGDTMWDIVKNVGMDEESIRRENKGIDFENLEVGERILALRCTK